MDYKNCVYRLYFDVEGDSRSYIGSTKSARGRLRLHILGLLKKTHSNNMLQLAFNKYGYLAYRWEILENDIDPNNLLQREYEYIKKYKADTEGFNQTNITTNTKSNEQYIPRKIIYDNKEYIKWWIKNKEVEFKEIRFSSRNIEPDSNSYSKRWWNTLTPETLNKFEVNLYNYVKHISNVRIFTTMMICGCGELIENYDKTDKIHTTIRSLIRKYKKQPNTSKAISDIIVTSALNPLHIEMSYMSPKEINEYRVATLFRMLQDCKLEDKITIHLPHKYYKGMVEVIKAEFSTSNLLE